MNNAISGKESRELPYMFQEKYRLEYAMLGKVAT